MFRGATKAALDDKGRMVMPTRFREQIVADAQGKVVVTVDRDKCLLIYPQPEWERVEQKLMSLPMLPQARRLQRLMVGHAAELELDGHFRFLLPPELREVAKLERQVMLVGQGNRIELWNEARWIELRGVWLETESTTDLQTELDSFTL